MIVADTNTIAYLYLNSEKSAQAEQLLTFEPKWIAPSLWKSEFRNVLTLYLRKNILTLDEILMISQQAGRGKEPCFVHATKERKIRGLPCR